jgi:hypothetical protein
MRTTKGTELRPSFSTSSDWLVRRVGRTVHALMPPGSATGATGDDENGPWWLLCTWHRDRYEGNGRPDETVRLTVHEAWLWAQRRHFRGWVVRRTAEQVELLLATAARELSWGAAPSEVFRRFAEPGLNLRQELDHVRPRRKERLAPLWARPADLAGSAAESHKVT